MDDNLSTERTEKVLQYQDLTGIEDMMLCRDALQRHNWDLEAAVQDQLNIREGRPSVFSTQRTSTAGGSQSGGAPPAVVVNDPTQTLYVAPAANYPIPWELGGLGVLANFVMRFVYNAVVSVFDMMKSLLWNRRTLTSESSDPVADVVGFLSYYEATFGPHHPIFYQGSFSQALQDASTGLHFLVVYLHTDNVECTQFCRNTLSDSRVTTLMDALDILFWGCSIDRAEGRRAMNLLKAKVFPFIGIVMLRQNKMTLISRLVGNSSPSVFASRLRDIVNANIDALNSVRSSRMERVMNQNIRDQQDEAYMASLRADQEKKRLKDIQKQAKMREEEDRLRQLELENQKKLDLLNLKEEYVKRLPPEPAVSDEACVQLSFKMPDGKRLERRFLNTNTLKDMYCYIFSQPNLSENFEISTSFPKRILECSLQSTIMLKDAGLEKREVLFVCDLES